MTAVACRLGAAGGPGAQARRFGGALYNWKAKYGGLDVSEAKRLPHIEDENTKLKKLPPERMLDAAPPPSMLSIAFVGIRGYSELKILADQST